jgi:arginine/lysine/ornithine decarboxylase
MLKSAIDKYLRRNLAQFHSPAHKGSLNVRDLSELTGLDDLQYPTGAIAETQEMIASLFGAARSFMLVNGASVGMMAAILALRMQSHDAKPLLVARNVHKSVIAGIILAGFDVEWFEPEWISELACYGRHIILSEAKNLQQFCGIVLTNPTYEGFYSDLPKFDIPLIVDEAHGAHYKFSSALPKTALESGADISVQSWHKALGSLTQTGVLHVAHKSRIDTQLVAAALRLLQTTSPSYLLMESISSTAELYAREGESIIERALDLSSTVTKIKNQDPLRANIYIPNYPLRGEYLFNLFEAEGIALEKYSENSVLAFISPFVTADEIVRLNTAYNKIANEVAENYHLLGAERLSEQSSSKPNYPKQAIDPRTAFLLYGKDASINSELYAPCPPGLATLVPGHIKPTN